MPDTSDAFTVTDFSSEIFVPSFNQVIFRLSVMSLPPSITFAVSAVVPSPFLNMVPSLETTEH